jgi:hypothetical protein
VSYEERRTAASRLNARIAEVREGWGSGKVFEENRELLGQLVSRVSLAQNGHEPRYVSAEFDDDWARVTVFLESAVVDASFKEGALIVDVLPLDIASIRITATQDVLDGDSRFDPEQPLAVNVTLVEGRTLTLRGTGDENDQLTRYLPLLFAKTTG